MSEERKFRVKGMHCSSCVLLIDEELETINGVESSETSLRKEQTTVKCREDVDDETIVAAIKELGYVAQRT